MPMAWLLFFLSKLVGKAVEVEEKALVDNCAEFAQSGRWAIKDEPRCLGELNAAALVWLTID